MVAVSAFINVLPGVSDAFALITASSSGVYIAIYILTMLAHLKYRKSKEFMPDGFVMPAYKVLNPLTIVFFLFVFVCLFLQDQHTLERLEQPYGSFFLEFTAIGNIINKQQNSPNGEFFMISELVCFS